jgi:hypothetical protein
MILHHPRPRPEPWSVVRSRVKNPWKLPFVANEHVFGWAVHLLGNWAFLETLFYLESLSVLVAVIFYFGDANNRLVQRHYQAWQVINTAQGKGGNGGRIDALQELVKDGVSLTGVDLAGAFLQGVRLDKGTLIRSNFHNADLRGSSLVSADLSDSDLTGANFRNATLTSAVLKDADLTDADLSGSNLQGVDLNDANLDGADMRGADLKNVHWEQVKSVKSANLDGAKSAPPRFIQWALDHGAMRNKQAAEAPNLGGH